MSELRATRTENHIWCGKPGMTDITTVIVCGDDSRLDTRPDCLNRLHDHPLPAGYVQAHAEASRRINARWRNRRCPDCNTYGWEKP